MYGFRGWARTLPDPNEKKEPGLDAVGCSKERRGGRHVGRLPAEAAAAGLKQERLRSQQ